MASRPSNPRVKSSSEPPPPPPPPLLELLGCGVGVGVGVGVEPPGVGVGPEVMAAMQGVLPALAGARVNAESEPISTSPESV